MGVYDSDVGGLPSLNGKVEVSIDEEKRKKARKGKEEKKVNSSWYRRGVVQSQLHDLRSIGTMAQRRPMAHAIVFFTWQR